jgi:shikimate kinase
MKIVLIGYRCTGKTSVGKRLAELLGLPFYDTDELVQGKAGKSIREMVDQEGWETFRKQERAIIKTLPAAAGAVIAAGGGAVMDAANRKALKHNGLCVWLTADIRTILKRMRNDKTSDTQRPPLSGIDMEQETAKTLAARRPLYQEMADCTIDTSAKGIDAVVDEISSCLRLGLAAQRRSRNLT